MDQKLRAVVARIEVSKLSEEEKLELYNVISEGLRSTVWPILLKYMPKDQLEELAKEPNKVTIEAYGKLIEDTIADGKALADIEQLMNQIIEGIDKALTEQGLPLAPQL